MTFPVCPCDGAERAPPVNLPGLSHIEYRVGTFADFRNAVLTPLSREQTLSVDGLPVWRTSGAGDLAVMTAEWFAYIADILTFYNERIANEDYLRTAVLPASVDNLIALLGYRPRPAIGATGALAALVSPGPSFGGAPVTLPKGLQFQSKPTPGQPPQIFELSQDTPIVAPDQYPAAPPPRLLGSVFTPVWRWTPYHAFGLFSFSFGGGAIVEQQKSTLLLQGAVKSINPGALMLLSLRDGSAGPWLAKVTATSVGPAPSGGGSRQP